MTVEVYIQIRKGKGKKLDTIQHTCKTQEEAVQFIKQHVKA